VGDFAADRKGPENEISLCFFKLEKAIGTFRRAIFAWFFFVDKYPTEFRFEL
jgi:hypothetical protein